MTPVTGSVRTLLLVAAVLVFLAGFQLTLFPERTADWFSWTIDTPMTAVFLGASYWSAVVLEVAGARAAGWGRARLTVWAVLVFTALTFVVTLVHLDAFHLGPEHPASARLVTWGWLAIYAGVPALMLLGLIVQRRTRAHGTDPGRERCLPGLLRWLLAGLAVSLVTAGAAMLLVPEQALDVWSWPLTLLTARAVGAWLVGLGWAAGHAALINDVADARPLGLTGAAFVVLQVIALLRYGDAVIWSGWQATAYIVGLAWIAVVSVWVLAGGAMSARAPVHPPV